MSSEEKAGEFRARPRAVRKKAEDRNTPEPQTGAGPADQESPEFSRGQPLDDPQPSARPRPDAGDPADSRPTGVSTGERAWIEALLEGVPLPATRADLITCVKRQGETQAVRRLKSLPDRRYSWIDEVGEALQPVQPQWPRERRVPKPESDLPPGGPAYALTNGGQPG